MATLSTQDRPTSAGSVKQQYFTAQLALDRTHKITFDALKAEVGKLPAVVGQIAATMRPGSTKNDVTLFFVGSIPITIFQRDRPIDPASLERTFLLNTRTWPAAKAALDDHKAHVHLIAGTVAENHEQAVAISTIMTGLATAISRMTPCAGVHWMTSDILLSPGQLLKVIDDWTRFGMPLQLWVQPLIYRSQSASSITTTVLTEGLKPFVGYEIEMTARNVPLEKMTKVVSALTHCFLLQGMGDLVDGMKFGSSGENGVWAMSRRKSMFRTGLSVISMAPA